MTEKCLWKSPHKSADSFSIVESSLKFEKKYGIQVFSDAMEKTDSLLVPVKPSDLEFSPDVRKFIGKIESTSLSQSVLSGSKNDSLTAEIVAASKSMETPVKESSATITKSATAHAESSLIAAEKNDKSYLHYKGVSFGQTQSPPEKSTFSRKVDPSLSFNPWFLSDGFPNFTRNTAALPSGTFTTTAIISSIKKRARDTDSSDNNIEVKQVSVANSGIAPSVTAANTNDLQATTTHVVGSNGSQAVVVTEAAELSEEESLLLEIQEEIRRTKEMDQKIVDAIVGTTSSCH